MLLPVFLPELLPVLLPMVFSTGQKLLRAG